MSRRPGVRVPLYQQMYTVIKARIESREWDPGHQLPPEWQLADEFGVSRGTTRQAVTRLVNEGLVDRSAGRGTFVARRSALTYPVRDLMGFSEQIAASGRTPRSRVVGVDTVARDEAAESFGFGDSVRRLVSIERVRLADEVPVALEHLLLPWPRFAGLAEMDLGTLGIYETLESEFEVTIQLGDFDLSIADLTERQAGLLEVRAGDPVFLMRGCVTNTQGAVVVGVSSYYRRDAFSFQFSMARREHTADTAATAPPNTVLFQLP